MMTKRIRCKMDQKPINPFAYRGPGTDNVQGILPALPTEASPGTDAKIEVMAERLQRGEQLFHPDDGVY